MNTITSSRPRKLGAVLAVLATILVGSPVAAQDYGTTTNALKGEGRTWERDSIPVCFEQSAATWPDERAWVQDAVERSWEAASAIDFNLWQDCAADGDGIRVAFSDEVPHTKELGSSLDGVPDGLVINVEYQNFNVACRDPNVREQCVRSTAVREFGHALGFGHEQRQADAEGCTAALQGSDAFLDLTPYDPDSVMRYCAGPMTTKLSVLDVAGVRGLYGPWDEINTSIALSGVVSITDGRLINPIGTERHELDAVLSVTGQPTTTTFSQCTDEVRVEVSVTATPHSELGGIQVDVVADMFEGADCESTIFEDTTRAAFPLATGWGHAFMSLRNVGLFDDLAEVSVIATRRPLEAGIVSQVQACQACNQEYDFASPLTPIVDSESRLDGDPTTTERLVAADPIEAAVMVSQERFPDDLAAHVALASSEVFADALAGSGLAGHGPLLFTPPSGIPQQVMEEIGRVLPNGGSVYVLGGVNALPDAIEEQLTVSGIRVQRLAGATRIETAIAVADVIENIDRDRGRVLIARANSPENNPTAAWADAITAGMVSARQTMPILLTNSDQLHPAVSEYLTRHDYHRSFPLGSDGALSQEVLLALPEPVRMDGPNRAGTAAVVANSFGPRDGRHTVINGYREDGWAWGLAVAGLAADMNAPTLLVNDSIVPPETLPLLGAGCGSTPSVDVLLVGPHSVISSSVETMIDRQDGGVC